MAGSRCRPFAVGQPWPRELVFMPQKLPTIAAALECRPTRSADLPPGHAPVESCPVAKVLRAP